MTGEARRVAAARAKAIRIVLGIIIVALSCALLVWGFLKPRRELRTQPISPTDLQLPTPASFHFDGVPFAMTSQPAPIQLYLVF